MTRSDCPTRDEMRALALLQNRGPHRRAAVKEKQGIAALNDVRPRGPRNGLRLPEKSTQRLHYR